MRMRHVGWKEIAFWLVLVGGIALANIFWPNPAASQQVCVPDYQWITDAMAQEPGWQSVLERSTNNGKRLIITWVNQITNRWAEYTIILNPGSQTWVCLTDAGDGWALNPLVPIEEEGA